MAYTYGQVNQDAVAAKQEANRLALHDAGRTATLQRARRWVFDSMNARGTYPPVEPITVTDWLADMERWTVPYAPEDVRQLRDLRELYADALAQLDALHLSPPVGADEL